MPNALNVQKTVPIAKNVQLSTNMSSIFCQHVLIAKSSINMSFLF